MTAAGGVSDCVFKKKSSQFFRSKWIAPRMMIKRIMRMLMTVTIMFINDDSFTPSMRTNVQKIMMHAVSGLGRRETT